MPRHDPDVSLILLRRRKRKPMRGRNILNPPHPHRIIDMAEFINVSRGGGDGEGEGGGHGGGYLVRLGWGQGLSNSVKPRLRLTCDVIQDYLGIAPSSFQNSRAQYSSNAEQAPNYLV